jgi:hypothetical protein
MSNKIDTLEEKKKWYIFVKERINELTQKEKDSGELLLTEVREHITLAVALLEKIRTESAKLKEGSSEHKNKIFSPWEKRLDEAVEPNMLSEASNRRETE